jgi:hypothetical protein
MCISALEPGSWADWLLVIVGALGGIVAYLTLDSLRKQTGQAAKETLLLNRAYLQVDGWMAQAKFFTDTDGGQGIDCDIKFRVCNPSRTAARVEEISLKFNNTEDVSKIGRILVPGEGTWKQTTARTKPGKVFRLDGVVTYKDIFKKTRHRTFAQMLICTAETCRMEDAEGVGANDELEWNTD